MDEKDIKLKMLADLPIPIEGFGYMVMPPIKKIVEIGEVFHNALISSLLFEKKQLQNSKGIDEFTTYEIFLELAKSNEDFKDTVLSALDLYFIATPNFHIVEDEETSHKVGVFYLEQEVDGKRDFTVLESDHFDEMRSVLKIAYNIKEEKEEEFANEKAKKLWEKTQKNKEKLEKYSKSGVDMHSLLSGVLWKSTKPISEILQLNIYQLYDGLHRLKNIDEYEHINVGVYTGNIDPKENKSMLSNLHWTTKINLEE